MPPSAIPRKTLTYVTCADAITTCAHTAGGKVVLVGDWAQLGAIEAGGAFHMLASHRPDAPELRDVRRFEQPWEAGASTALRVGDPVAIEPYVDHGRVPSGDREARLDAVIDAWRADTNGCLDSVMIATDGDAVAALNALAQAHRLDTGAAHHADLRTGDGQRLGVGDQRYRPRPHHQQHDARRAVRRRDSRTPSEHALHRHHQRSRQRHQPRALEATTVRQALTAALERAGDTAVAHTAIAQARKRSEAKRATPSGLGAVRPAPRRQHTMTLEQSARPDL